MTDDEVVQKLDQLLDKKFSASRAEFDNQFTSLNKKVDDGFAAVTKQIDVVAGHLEVIEERVTKVETTIAAITTRFDGLEETLTEQGNKLDRIERVLTNNRDRTESHGERIGTLERKTAHLPMPSPK